MITSTRFEVIAQLADLIIAVERPHPVRVAIDGVDAAGKTMLADELAQLLEARGQPVVRASIDGFHNPKDIWAVVIVSAICSRRIAKSAAYGLDLAIQVEHHRVVAEMMTKADIRYRQGADSPQGYFQDSFDHAAILRAFLAPLGPGGNRIYRRSVYDTPGRAARFSKRSRRFRGSYLRQISASLCARTAVIL